MLCSNRQVRRRPQQRRRVTTAKPNSQPPRKARLLGRGCGECTTSTAGITDNGESAMTNASGTSPVSTETQ